MHFRRMPETVRKKAKSLDIFKFILFSHKSEMEDTRTTIGGHDQFDKFVINAVTVFPAFVSYFLKQSASSMFLY
jgi:hypothetical protein